MKKSYCLLFICIIHVIIQPAHGMFTSGVRKIKLSTPKTIKIPRSYTQKQLTPVSTHSWISNKFSTVKHKILSYWNNAFDFSIRGIKRLQKNLDGPAFLEKTLDLDSNYAQTPSYRHLVCLRERFNSTNISLIAKNSYFKNMIHHALDKEKEMMATHEIFYHATRWQYGFLSDVYGMLYSYKSGEELNDFIFTHIDDPILGEVSEDFFKSEAKKRRRLLKEGNLFFYDITKPIGRADRQSLLFLNKFLFGNSTNPGSSSIDYFIDNRNVGNIDFTLKEIFSMFGYSDIYQQYKNELLELQDEYNRLSIYGQMLQILVPKDMVGKSVYYTMPNGPKAQYILTSAYPKLVITTNIKKILEDIDKHPRDTAEFVGIETSDKFGFKNPKSGIKIFSYNAVDPAKMAMFKEKENNLFARIQKSLKRKELQENRKQLAAE